MGNDRHPLTDGKPAALIDATLPSDRIERIYWEGISSLSGAERLNLVNSMFGSMRRLLKLQSEQRMPALPEEESMRRVAMRMYEGDPEALRLLEKARKS